MSEPDAPFAAPVQAKERIAFVDVLRGLAMLAILIENMALYSGRPYDLRALSAPLDRALVVAIQFLLEAKSYSLFAFLFGWGLAMQIARAEGRGTRPLYLRRLAVLLAFGLLHGILIWSGDVLALYAFLGALLLLFRRRSPKTILAAAALCLAFSIALRAPGEAMDAFRSWYERLTGFLRYQAYPQSLYAAGTYLQITRLRIQDYLAFHSRLIYYAGNLLAMFLLGLYVGKRRLLQEAGQHLPRVRQAMWIGLAAGLPLNALYVAVNLQPSSIPFAWYEMVRVGARTLGAPALLLFYVCAVILLANGEHVVRNRVFWSKLACQNPVSAPRALLRLASVGRMSLSNYLFQSVVCTLFFYHYGLGLYGQVGPAFGLVLAVVIYQIQLWISEWWFERYQFGPLEWVWRTLTYGRRQPLRVGQTYDDLKPVPWLHRARQAILPSSPRTCPCSDGRPSALRAGSEQSEGSGRARSGRVRSPAPTVRSPAPTAKALALVSIAVLFLSAGALAAWYARSREVTIITRPRTVIVPVTAMPAARQESASTIATPAVHPATYDPGPIAASGDLLALAATFDVDAAMAQIEALTGPPYLGRYAGSPQGWAAGEAIARQFAAYGLQPAGKEGTFFQPFPIEYATLAQVPSLIVADASAGPGTTPRSTSYVLHRDFAALGRWYAGTGTADGEVVWADHCDREDLAAIEVVDKVVLCRATSAYAASAQEAQRNAMEHGAAGLLLLTDPAQRPPDFGNIYGEPWVPEPLPSFLVFPPVAEGLLRGSGMSVHDLSIAFAPFPLRARARMQVAFTGPEACPSGGCQGRNVLGVLPGRDPAYAHQVVILGAHYDHLGQAPDGTIWPGANDNASGVAVLLEIARSWQAQGYVPRRTVLFAAWDAEEEGLLGSSFYVAHPRYPLQDTAAKIQLDMVGAGADTLWIDGRNALGDQIRAVAEAMGVETAITNHGRSDHTPFLAAGIPASLLIWSFEGDAVPHYHRPVDTPATIDPTKLRAAGQIAGVTLLALAEGEPALADLLARRAAAVMQGDLDAFLATSLPGQKAADRRWFGSVQALAPTRFAMEGHDLRILGHVATANVRMAIAYQVEGKTREETLSLAARFVPGGDGWRWAGPDLTWMGQTGSAVGEPATTENRFAVACPPGKEQTLRVSETLRVSGLGQQAAGQYARMATLLGLTAQADAALLLFPSSEALRASTALSLPGETAWVGPGEVRLVYSEGISTSQQLSDALARLVLAEAGVTQAAAPWLWQGLPAVLCAGLEKAPPTYLPRLRAALAAETAPGDRGRPDEATAWAAVDDVRQQAGWEGLGRLIAALGQACRDEGYPGRCEGQDGADLGPVDRALRDVLQQDSASFEQAWQAHWRERLAAIQEGVDDVLAARMEAVLSGDEAAFLDTIDVRVPNLAAEEGYWFASLADRPLERFSLSGEPLALREDGSVLATVTMEVRLAGASSRQDEATVPLEVVFTPDTKGAHPERSEGYRWAGPPFEALQGQHVRILYPAGHSALAQDMLAQAEAAYAHLAAELRVGQPDASKLVDEQACLVIKLYETGNAFRTSISATSLPAFPSAAWAPAWTERGASLKIWLNSGATFEPYRSTLAVHLARHMLGQMGVDAEWLLKGASLYLAGAFDGGIAERALASHLERTWRTLAQEAPYDLAAMPADHALSAEEWWAAGVQAWDAVRYLALAHGHDALVDLLHRQGQGLSLDAALQAATGQTLPDFTASWAASLAHAHARPEWVTIARSFDPQQAHAHVTALASPEMAGRQAGSPGAARAAAYLAEQFAAYGLLPAGDLTGAGRGTTFLQRFPISYTTFLSAPRLEIVDREGQVVEALAYRQDFVALVSVASLTRGGWGEGMGELVWVADADYAGMELDGKIALRRPSSAIEAEVAQAVAHGAGGLILVGQKEKEKEALARQPLPLFFSAGRSIPVLELTRPGYQRLLAECVPPAIEQIAPNALPALPLGLHVRLAVPLGAPETVQAANVLGLLPGSDPALRDRVLVLAAGYDYVGDDPEAVVCPSQVTSYELRVTGQGAGCERVAGRRYPGANEGASGVGVLLEVARLWHEAGYRPRYSVLFAAWGAHEAGAAGLRYYITHPVFSLERTAAVLQLGAVGGGEGYCLDAYGTREREGLLRFSMQAADEQLDGRLMIKKPSGESDPAPLRQAGVPTLFLNWRDARAENWPAELADPIELRQLRVTGQMVTLAAMTLAR